MAETLAITQPPVGSNQRFFTDHATSCPIRAELYGLDHLEALARELAAASAVVLALLIVSAARRRRLAQRTRVS